MTRVSVDSVVPVLDSYAADYLCIVPGQEMILRGLDYSIVQGQ